MKSLLLGIGFAVTVVAVGLLFASGSFSAKDSPEIDSSDDARIHSTAPAGGNGNIGTVASLVTGLEDRLQEQPDDGKGWLLLAKSYRHLGRLDEAREAYRKADVLGQGDATVAAQLFGLTSENANEIMDEN